MVSKPIDKTIDKKQLVEDTISKQINIQLSDFDIDRLKAWDNDGNPYFTQVHFMGDDCLYMLGKKQFEVKNGREKAEWDDFFQRMLDINFIAVDSYDKKGRPNYKLAKAAFNYIDGIK